MGSWGRGRAFRTGGTYIGAPLVNHVQVHVVERVDLGHSVVRRRVQRNQHQLHGCCKRGWVSGAGGRGRGRRRGRGGGSSPQPGAENLTTNGSRLKASSVSGYWYVSTTDTVSFLEAGGKGRVGAVSGTPAPRAPWPLPSPVDEQVHFLILVPTQGLTAHEAVLVPGHAAEIRAGPGVKASLRDLGSGPGLPTLDPASRTC